MEFDYLASPYSHIDPAVKEARFDAVCRVAARLTREGVHVFSPIAHSHPIAKHGTPTTWRFWEDFDRFFIDASRRVRVLRLPGWKESDGIKNELRIAGELGKPIIYMDPED